MTYRPMVTIYRRVAVLVEQQRHAHEDSRVVVYALSCVTPSAFLSSHTPVNAQHPAERTQPGHHIGVLALGVTP